VGRKKKLKYGFYYTWKDITPRSKIVTVKALDLEDARSQAREKSKKLSATAKPQCHWITMPQDYNRIITRERLKAKKHFWWKYLQPLIVVILLVLLMALLSSCSLQTCNQSLSRFNKRLTNWTNERYGIKTYYLEPLARPPNVVEEK
jgi:hypothetical protein